MICRECKSAIIGPSKEDKAMNKQGYRSCALATTPVERATYYTGGNKFHLERVKK